MSDTVKPKGEGRKLSKPNNMVTVPCKSMLDFFKEWCIFLRPFIQLTDREIDVTASFLHQRWKLSKTISDPSVIDVMLMTEDIKNKVMEEAHMTQAHFYVVTSNLKKRKVIENGVINSRLIPNIRMDDNGMFQLLLLFIQNDKQ